MKYLKNIEFVTGVIWAIVILLVSIFSQNAELKDYNWLVITTAAGFQISYLSDFVRRLKQEKHTKC